MKSFTNGGFLRRDRRSGSIFSLVLVFVVLLPTAVCMFLGLHLSIVTSGSMRPAIDPGDVVLTRYEPASSLTIGQVILYFNTEKGTEISHRISSIVPQGNLISITTKGDANPVADAPVLFNAKMPIPVSKLIIPKIGYLLIKLTGGFGRLIFALVFISVLGNLFRKRSNKASSAFSDSQMSNDVRFEKPSKSTWNYPQKTSSEKNK